MNYIELPATDITATKKFYNDVFDLDWIDYGPKYCAHESKHLTLALNGEAQSSDIHTAGEESAIGPFLLFESKNLQSTLSSVEAANGKILSNIYSYPGGKRFHFVDPSGNTIGVYRNDQ